MAKSFHMMAVLKTEPKQGVELKDIPIPKPTKEEVLVKIKAASICGTDVSIYDWTNWARFRINPPIVIGHEIVGEVVEINSDHQTNLQVGDLVSSETHIFCNKCYQCKTGNKHICENMQLFGIGRNGGFSEYATIPIQNVWKNDKSLPIDMMSIQESLGNAVHAVTKARVDGKSVLILGLGPVGICSGIVAKVYGAKKVIGIDVVQYRTDLASDIGIDETFNTLSSQLYDKFDVVLEMSGNEKAIQNSLRAVRIGGIVIIFGIPKQEVTIDLGKYVINKELKLEGVFGRIIWDSWYQVQDILLNKKVDFSKLITHRFNLSDFEKAIDVMKSGNCGKILLTPK